MSQSIQHNLKINRSFLIKLIITIIIPTVILLIPTNEIYTSSMAIAIAATAAMLIWSAFEFSTNAIPAVLWCVVLMITNAAPASVVMAPYLGTTLYGAIGCMLLANVLNECGLLKRVAYLIAKACGGSFDKTVYGVFLATFAVSICTFASGSVVCAALCYGICKALNLVKTREGALMMMAGMLGASTVRMFMYYPVTMGALLTSVRQVDPAFNLTFFQLFKYNWPVFFYCLLFIFLMTHFGKKEKSLPNSKEYFASELQKLGKMTHSEKIGLAGVIVIMLWIVANPLHGLDPMYAFMIVPFLLCIPFVGCGSEKNIEDVPWGTILFFASCMAIGGVCNAVGITAFISEFTAPMLAGLGGIGTLLGVLFFGIILNFAMTPMAMLAGFSGMLYQLCASAGLNPLGALFAFNYATDIVLLPYEYLTFLVFFAFGCMTTGQFFKYHLYKGLLFIVFFVLIILPYWKLLGLV